METYSIVLSENHPSLLEDLVRLAGYCAPIVVSQDGVLIDGYRRYQMDPEIEVVQMQIRSIYDAAVTMNRNTRKWDETDRFLWSRWAHSLGVEHDPFPLVLQNAPVEMLHALANRKLHVGQALRILAAPANTWLFFTVLLAQTLTLNVNETATFVDMTFDLANCWTMKNLAQVFEHEILKPIVNDSNKTSKQRGEALLKAMRSLRYPLYQKKSEELSTAWKQLKLEKVEGSKELFLNRGVLQITIRARSQREMSEKVKELFDSLNAPAWSRLWNE